MRIISLRTPTLSSTDLASPQTLKTISQPHPHTHTHTHRLPYPLTHPTALYILHPLDALSLPYSTTCSDEPLCVKPIVVAVLPLETSAEIRPPAISQLPLSTTAPRSPSSLHLSPTIIASCQVSTTALSSIQDTQVCTQRIRIMPVGQGALHGPRATTTAMNRSRCALNNSKKRPQ